MAATATHRLDTSQSLQQTAEVNSYLCKAVMLTAAEMLLPKSALVIVPRWSTRQTANWYGEPMTCWLPETDNEYRQQQTH